MASKHKKKKLTRSQIAKKGWVTRKAAEGIGEIFEKLGSGYLNEKAWEYLSERQYLRRNRRQALEPSSLRHLGTVTSKLLKRLSKAHKKGDKRFRREVMNIALEFGVHSREVYTLWFSP